MAETLTHWKKLTNPDYLGSYALEPGQEIVVTIKSVANENVTGTDGKKENCSVMHFVEDIKPLVLKATNSKTITKLFKTPYIEEWVRRKIQLYVQKGIKAFGDIVDAIRVRDFLPVDTKLICADCGSLIEAYGKTSAATMAKYTLSKYGRMLCSDCATKAAEANKPADDGGVL